MKIYDYFAFVIGILYIVSGFRQMIYLKNYQIGMMVFCYALASFVLSTIKGK